MIRGITWTHIQSVLNHSGPSEVPYSAKQELVRNFFCCFLHLTSSSTYIFKFLIIFYCILVHVEYLWIFKGSLPLYLSRMIKQSLFPGYNLAGKKADVQSEVYEGEMNAMAVVHRDSKLIVGKQQSFTFYVAIPVMQF